MSNELNHYEPIKLHAALGIPDIVQIRSAYNKAINRYVISATTKNGEEVSFKLSVMEHIDIHTDRAEDIKYLAGRITVLYYDRFLHKRYLTDETSSNCNTLLADDLLVDP